MAATLEVSVQTFRDILAKTETDLRAKEMNVDDLRKEYRTLQSFIDEKQGCMSRLQDKNETVSKELLNTNKILQEMNTKLKDAVDENKRLREALSIKVDRVVCVKREVQALYDKMMETREVNDEIHLQTYQGFSMEGAVTPTKKRRIH